MAIHVLTTSEDAKPYVMLVQMMQPTPAENCLIWGVTRHAADTVLDIVERSNARQRFVGDRRRLQLNHIMELAADMRLAGSFEDLVAVEFFVAPITVGMHDAAEACQVVSRMRALAIRTVVIGVAAGMVA